MKKYVFCALCAVIGTLFLLPDLAAQDTIRNRQKTVRRKKVHQQHFVDKDGDGYNDNAPDHDGDGIPNRLDPDWKKRQKSSRPPFVDLNGDGVNDNLQTKEGRQRQEMDLKGGEEDGSSMKNQEQKQMRKGGKRKKG